MKTSRRTFIKQSALATVAVSGFGSLLLSEIGCVWAQTPNKDVDSSKALFPLWKSTYQSPLDPINQVPYISFYYIEPKVKTGEKAVINYYVTDYDQSDYMYDDLSAVFTIDYWVNGVKSSVKDVKAGDHSITLNPLPKGKVLLALQATDNQGRKSHRLFHEFLIVDPKEEVIPDDKVYRPDLKKFGIYNDDTHPVETSKGLTEMLQWVSDNKYRKVLLPSGTYRIDENNAVQMVSNLTLDMNGATFKLNPSLLDRLYILEMHNCFDSHVTNGKFEGDLKERDFEKYPGSGEWVSGIAISNGSEYCSYENVTVIDMTGHGTDTTMGGGGKGPHSITRPKKVGEFTSGDIDSNGTPIASADRMTTEKPVDISDFKDSLGFIQLGLYLGYQGNPTGSWVYQDHFYDADNKYLETIEGYFYRRLYLPEKVKYARFTAVPRDGKMEKAQKLVLMNFRQPYNCAFVNIHHENVRCVGMCPSGFVNFLAEKCTFENCGWAKAKCAFDAEDGWDLAQDLTFRNNTFGNNPHNEFLCVSGHNFVVENNVMAAHLRNRYFVLRNNKLKSASLQFGEQLNTGSPRVYGNTITGDTRLITKGTITAPFRSYCIRDNVCQGNATTYVKKGVAPVAYFYKCKIQGDRMGAKFVQCDFKDIRDVKSGSSFEIYESTIDNCLLKTTSHGAGDITVVDSKITNSQIEPTLRSVVLLQGNTMQKCSGSGDGVDHEWILRDNKIETSLEHLIAIEKNYKQITLENNTITSTNPNFSAIFLNGLIRPAETTVAIVKSTFIGKGGFALNMTNVPSGDRKLNVYLFKNKYNGIEEISKNALDASGVKITRAEPPAKANE